MLGASRCHKCRFAAVLGCVELTECSSHNASVPVVCSVSCRSSVAGSGSEVNLGFAFGCPEDLVMEEKSLKR